MPQITSIEPQKSSYAKASERRGIHRYNIFIDGQFAFGADEDLIVNKRLIVGKTLNKEDLDKLLFEAEVGKLMERMYGLFSIRMRSEKEVRDYLKNLSFKRRLKEKEEVSEAAINLLIERLKNKGIVNDLEFAKSWVEGRRKSKQKGIKALKMELYQKGIDREIIEQVINLQVTDNSEEELAKLALEKKMRIWKNLDPQEFKKKSYQFLAGKGFEFSIISDIVEKLTKKE